MDYHTYIYASLINAGIERKWERESILQEQDERGCASYHIYSNNKSREWVVQVSSMVIKHITERRLQVVRKSG